MSEQQSQCEIILRHFEGGGSLTVLEAIEAPFRCYALSQRCGQLARKGYPIHSEWVKLPNGKRIKRYSKELATVAVLQFQGEEYRLEA